MSQSEQSGLRFADLAQLEAFLYGMAEQPGEAPGLSELDHGLQCAAVLRTLAPEDVELQVAGLLHDIGAGLADDRAHGLAGACAVRALMGERVAELIRLHVDAKRYLVTVDSEYRARLSNDSIRTLALQGGDMRAAEVAAFASSPYTDDAVRLREADDLAKVPGKPVPGLDTWLPRLRRVARTV